MSIAINCILIQGKNCKNLTIFLIFFETLLVKPKEVYIFTIFLPNFKVYLHSKNHLKLKEFHGLCLHFAKVWRIFCDISCQTKGSLHFHEFFMPIFKVYLHCQKSCQIERTQRLCLHFAKLSRIFVTFFKRTFWKLKDFIIIIIPGSSHTC